MFDLVNLVPFIQKHKVNPVSGEAMSTSDIIRLKMAKNADGYEFCNCVARVKGWLRPCDVSNTSTVLLCMFRLWHCPVLFKVFNAHSVKQPPRMSLKNNPVLIIIFSSISAHSGHSYHWKRVFV